MKNATAYLRREFSTDVGMDSPIRFRKQRVRSSSIASLSGRLSFADRLPIISGMLMQLSKARPVKNLQTAKDQKVFALAVAIEARNPMPLQNINAGIRPLWSAIHPKSNPPMMAPQKKIDCADDMRYSRSHTQSS